MFNVFAVCVNAVGRNVPSRERSPVIVNPFGSFAFGGTRAPTLMHELPFAGSEDSAFVQNRMETKVPSPASFSNGTSDVLNDSSQ